MLIGGYLDLHRRRRKSTAQRGSNGKRQATDATEKNVVCAEIQLKSNPGLLDTFKSTYATPPSTSSSGSPYENYRTRPLIDDIIAGSLSNDPRLEDMSILIARQVGIH